LKPHEPERIAGNAPHVVVLFRRGREAPLSQAETRTELEELAVEAKRQQLTKQHALDITDVMLKVERIKDPQLREKGKKAILAGDPPSS
jgi:hypothetical protein